MKLYNDCIKLPSFKAYHVMVSFRIDAELMGME